MTKKELDKEIDFIHSNRTHKRLLRPLDTMRKVICEATNTYTNLSLFMNDYIHLYDKDLIEKDVFIHVMNDLYLLALLHTDYEDYGEEKNDK